NFDFRVIHKKLFRILEPLTKKWSAMDLSTEFIEIDWHDLPVDYLWLDFDASKITLQCSEFDDEADEYKPINIELEGILNFSIRNLRFDNPSGIGDFYDAEVASLEYEWLAEAEQHRLAFEIVMGISESPALINVLAKQARITRRKRLEG
ncbi:MAG: hypothetical protein KDH97_18645, partial [Calditrichaeota bacterium]|nr:hypothetical protein [Calditrichota bacterium]MCB0315004.1 hypothetical protein [Calditrichota bacterium]